MFSFKKKKRRKKTISVDTFTKLWVNRILVMSWICIFWCFILATIGREQVAENLATAIVTNVVGVFIGYLAKSFFENREKNRPSSSTSNDIHNCDRILDDNEFTDL